MNTCTVKIFGDLHFFLKNSQKKEEAWYTFSFIHKSTVRDVATSLGIAPPEIQTILLNDESTDLDTTVNDEDCISLYPGTLSGNTFILDVHLGTLNRYLRMLGFDSYYRNDLTDDEIINLAGKDRRVILTRDLGILKNSKVKTGYFLRETLPERQIREIVRKFDLKGKFEPLTRCLTCNGILKEVGKINVKGLVPERAWNAQEQFYKCNECGNIYWQGSHFRNMQQFITKLQKN